jgi:hypothetical protein
MRCGTHKRLREVRVENAGTGAGAADLKHRAKLLENACTPGLLGGADRIRTVGSAVSARIGPISLNFVLSADNGPSKVARQTKLVEKHVNEWNRRFESGPLIKESPRTDTR